MQDKCFETLRKVKGRNMKRIDMHIHSVMHYDEFEKQSDILRPYPNTGTFATPEELKPIYERLGIEKGVLLPIVSMEGQHRMMSNEEIYRIACAYPDMFYWYCNADPRWYSNSKDTDLGFFLEHYKKLGAKGIGEVTSKLAFDDPRMRNLFYHAQKLRMPLLFHIGAEKEPYGIFDMLGLPLLEKTLMDFPDLILIGHSASFWSHISKDVTEETRSSYNKGPVTEGGRIPKLMRMYPNLLADISANSGYYAITRDPDFGYAFLEEFQDRLFYGTDICAPREYVFYNMVNFLDDGYKNNRLSKAAYDKINRLNAEYILK